MPGRRARQALLLALTLSLGALPAASEAQTCSGYVGITFDDGPSGSTAALLNALRSAGLTPVTFFNTGQAIASNPSLVAQQSALGSVQNHSYTHGHMTSMSQADMQSELSRTNQAITSNGGGTPRLFRPPYGETNSTLQSVASGLGLRVVTWDVDSQDWNNASTASIVSAAGRLTNGQVILMHEWPANTVAAIPQIAANLRSRGLCPGVIDPGTGRAVAPGGGTSYALTVTKSGTGSGTVAGGAINCGSTCSANVASGTAVTLTATPAAGSTFGGWGGSCTGTGSCIVTMTAARSVSATFNTSGGTTYALTVTKSGTGSGTVSGGPINCGATCSANVASGTAVTLSATPASGSTFGGWGGSCTGSGSCILTMTTARSVTATFNGTVPTGTVSINAGGSATGSWSADQYFSGGNTYSTTRTIDTSLVTGAVPPQAVFQTERYGEFTYTVPGRSGAQAVTLYFQESYWTAAGQRTFNVSINGTAVLSAFDIFAAAGGTNRAIARTFETTANASGQVVIQFSRNGPDQPKICGITVAAGGGDPGPTNQTLAVTKAGTGSGTVTGSGVDCGSACSASYATGTSVTLTVTAASGSTFAGWSGACSGIGACVVSMTAARSVTATFNTSGGDPGGTCKAVTGGNSGNFNTTAAICFTVSTTVSGWGCSNTAGRTVTVNGTAVSCGQTPLPGSAPYTFSFTAGTYPWASFYWW